MSEPAPQRWNAGTVYDDMWVDPADDPRGTDRAAPDGELPTLLSYLRSYRLTIRMKTDGLDADQLAARSVPPSTLSLLGLVRHLARVEQTWGRRVLQQEDVVTLFPGDSDFDDAVGDPAMVAEAFELWESGIAATDDAIAGFTDLGVRVPHGDDPVAVREVIVHLIEEYARHAGHADLLRERIDGRTGQ